MIKFSYRERPVIDNYWDYCMNKQIPHIEIIATSIDELVLLSADLLPCINKYEIPGDCNQNLSDIFRSYEKFFALSKETRLFTTKTFQCKVFKDHAEFIAKHLFDYYMRTLKEKNFD